MTFGEFFSDRLGRLVLHGSCIALTAAFLLVTGTQPGIVLLVLIAWCLIFIIVQASDFIKCRTHLSELEAIMEGLDQKYLFMECVPRPHHAYVRKLFALMRQSSKAMIETVSDAQTTQREYQAYIEGWVHEIKTPITAAQLICSNADATLRRKLSQELAQIDNHVERALFYARAESADRDFIIRKALLSELVAQAIERHRTLLIQNGIRIETEGLDCLVYSDDKWVCFMLGQLLQNAARYRKSEDPFIILTARQIGQQVALSVQDNGIGIPAHELHRVFDRGFTGSNGRTRGGATGMGLYLCRRLASFLGIEIQIASKENQGTTVTLTFPAKEHQ